MERLKLQLSDTFESMKQEGLVDEHFAFVYSLKKNIEDHFYLEIIPEFCCDVRETLKLLKQMIKDQSSDSNLLKVYVYKVKGSSSSFGACRMAEALTDFERAIEADSKEECLKVLNRAQREFSVLEEKLHTCLQLKLERRIVVLATEGTNM
ncbi:Histidine-containing phosphotransfer protein 1, partial [Mucuna pruriens]